MTWFPLHLCQLTSSNLFSESLDFWGAPLTIHPAPLPFSLEEKKTVEKDKLLRIWKFPEGDLLGECAWPMKFFGMADGWEENPDGFCVCLAFRTNDSAMFFFFVLGSNDEDIFFSTLL